MRNNLGEDYSKWLFELVGVHYKKNSYCLLLNDLHSKAFNWHVPNDDNRACEGKILRERYCAHHNLEYECDYFPEEASMLELMIALAYRCDDITFDQIDAMPMKDWFWILCRNSGLDQFNDNDYYRLRGPAIVDQILDRIINRTYLRNGGGGLFPLKNTKKDQRKVELWYQMNLYLVENY